MIYPEKKIRTIGLVTEDAFTDFPKEILHSVVHSVMDRKDIRIVVITGRSDDSNDPDDKMHQYKNVYNEIYNINGMCPFDGLLFTVPIFSEARKKMFGDIPKVFIASDRKDETTVNYDDEMGIREAIDYLVRIKGFTKICMIGGREDNADARKRRAIFIKLLEENGIRFEENMYEKSDMTTASHRAAAALLNRNPDVEAIFCVNDQTASGLYDVMLERGLTPGRDITVFGFDNTSMGADMVPPLASIGTDGETLGQKALEMLLAKMNGEEVSSQTVPTRLFDRGSFDYSAHDYFPAEMLTTDSKFIYRFFDKCFYRYRNEIINNRDIDLKRLFYEIFSKMIGAVRNRYMSEEEFNEIKKLIDIMFENGVMKYTDANRFVNSTVRIQNSMNRIQKSGFVDQKINALFSYMRDKAILAQAFSRNMEINGQNSRRDKLFDFTIHSTNFGEPLEESMDSMIKNISRLGFNNSALFLYDEPVITRGDDTQILPDKIYMKCVVRDGELFITPEDRQECPIADIYNRGELPQEKMGYVTYPLFYGEYLFGILLCGLSRTIIETGEFLTAQIGRTIYINRIKDSEA